MDRLLRVRDFNLSNSILYVLYVCDEYSIEVSKIGIQKIFYLSQVLEPIRDIADQVVKFVRNFRGPYSKELQNELDHLCAYGLVDLVKFEVIQGKNSIAVYQIGVGGINAVNELIKYSKEEDRFWWISTIVRSCNLFFDNEVFDNENNEYNGFDNIVNLVYQDPTFKEYEERNIRTLIELGDDTVTASLLKQSIQHFQNLHNANEINERNVTEFLILGYFNYLLGKYIESNRLEGIETGVHE